MIRQILKKSPKRGLKSGRNTTDTTWVSASQDAQMLGRTTLKGPPSALLEREFILAT